MIFKDILEGGVWGEERLREYMEDVPPQDLTDPEYDLLTAWIMKFGNAKSHQEVEAAGAALIRLVFLIKSVAYKDGKSAR